MKDNTELRPIKDHPNYYASTEGFIYRKMKGRPRYQSKTTKVHKFINEQWFLLLKGSFHGKLKNYIVVSFGRCFSSKTIHRLILSTFNPHPNQDNLQVNHIDRNTFNNRLENLEWVTNQVNCKHAAQTCLPKSYKDMKADYINYINSIPSDLFIPQEIGEWSIKYDIEAIKTALATTSDSMEEIAKQLGCSFRAVKYWQEKLKIQRPKKWNDSLILDLWHQGHSSLEISALIGCSRSKVTTTVRGKVQRSQVDLSPQSSKAEGVESKCSRSAEHYENSDDMI